MTKRKNCFGKFKVQPVCSSISFWILKLLKRAISPTSLYWLTAFSNNNYSFFGLSTTQFVLGWRTMTDSQAEKKHVCRSLNPTNVTPTSFRVRHTIWNLEVLITGSLTKLFLVATRRQFLYLNVIIITRSCKKNWHKRSWKMWNGKALCECTLLSLLFPTQQPCMYDVCRGKKVRSWKAKRAWMASRYFLSYIPPLACSLGSCCQIMRAEWSGSTSEAGDWHRLK